MFVTKKSVGQPQLVASEQRSLAFCRWTSAIESWVLPQDYYFRISQEVACLLREASETETFKKITQSIWGLHFSL